MGGFLNLVAVPTMFTMFLVGVWHGAGLQFLIFGFLHGIYLTVNQLWRILRSKKTHLVVQSSAVRHFNTIVCVAGTLMAAVVADVFFRAQDTRSALSILASMAGARGFAMQSPISSSDLLFAGRLAVLWIVVWTLPNTQQILSRYEPASEVEPNSSWLGQRIAWSPSVSWALVLGLVFLSALILMQDPSRFLYFQF